MVGVICSSFLRICLEQISKLRKERKIKLSLEEIWPLMSECYEQCLENQLVDASTATKKEYDDDGDLIVCWLSSKRKVTKINKKAEV
uniref:Uncharacterized protein n=1 Tax=Cucumis melo TaxID=3656 RepID=A0A9I9ECU3_CUCME